MLTALTRKVSSTIAECQLTFMERQSIDYQKACKQHQQYETVLQNLGLELVTLCQQPQLPDAVFVEDGAVVVDEVAVIAIPARASRRGEIHTLAAALEQFKSIEFLTGSASLEGGDVIQDGMTLYVGLSTRTNLEGATQLSGILSPHGYEVKTVKVSGCLHLSTAVSCLNPGVFLLNPLWVDTGAFSGCEIVNVPAAEPWAANVLVLDHMIVIPEACLETAALLRQRGFTVTTIDISEFQKAEAGLTCMSLIF
ncbi:MAG TPA: arginine deiminase-related protein [Candidatus Angelobacter sp.]|jgi:dimethylargininase|nr:arginine deiminase-related protein [Candidatus Angelobacter sp.]